jgi:hypothetical protein
MNRMIFGLVFTIACAPEAADSLTGLERPTTIPDYAVEVAPDVFYLGEEVDPQSGEIVEGHAFVDRAPGYGPTVDSAAFRAKGKPGGGCYAFIGFPKWGSAESWGVGSGGTSGISSSTIRTEIESAIGAWESASSTNIFGDYNSTFSGVARTTADGENNIQFGDAGGGGTVAVTYVWGSRRIAIFEWDQIYGDSWDWTVGAPNTSAFEFLAVATHEVGHAAGMDHPSSGCTAETMYAYVDFGETHQITLNTGDVAGINALY